MTPSDSPYGSRPLTLAGPQRAHIWILTSDGIYLFWQRDSALSQWFMSDFVHEEAVYNCAEQFVMAQKAVRFGDVPRDHHIMVSSDPQEQKAYGRSVSGLDEQLWALHRLDIAFQASLSNFGQNPDLQRFLFKTCSEIKPARTTTSGA